MQLNIKPRRIGFFDEASDAPMTVPAATPTPTLAPVGAVDLKPLRYREDSARSLLEEGSDSSPLHGGGALEALGRVGKAIVGGMQLRKATDELGAARKTNLGVMKQMYDDGDYMGLIGSEDPIAQKLGSAVLEQRAKHDKGHTQVIDGVTVWQSDNGGPPTIISRPEKPIRPIIKDNLISYDEGKTWGEIPGAVAAHKAYSDAGRAPKVTKPAKNSSKFPWEQ